MKKYIAIFCVLINLGQDLYSNDIEEVVVTGSLIPIYKKESANAITVINYNDLKNRSVSSISDLLRNVPGLAVSRSGVRGSQTQIRVRGSEANHLLVLVDGIEANNLSQSDEFNWGTLVATDIEKIEIIRGPQSSMYGSDAVSGVINIITRRTKEPKSLSIFSERGNFSTQNNALNLGYKNDNFDAYIGLGEIKTAGENIARFGSEKDGYKNRNINIKSGLRLNKKLKTLFLARYSNGTNDYDSDNDFDGLIEDQDNVAKFKKQNIGIKVQHNSINEKWQQSFSITQSVDNNKDFANRLIGTTTSSNKEQFKYISSIFFNEFDNRVSILAEHEKEKFTQSGLINDYGIYGIYDPNQKQNRKTDSIAVEYRSNIHENLSLALSSRQDFNSEFKNSHTYKMESVYYLSSNTKLRSSYGTAIKNPTFTERFGYFTNFIGNPMLQPEKSRSFELGYDYEIKYGSQSLSATIFKSDLENEIDGNAFDPIANAYTAINKNGTSKRKGLEFNFYSKIRKNLTLSFAHTYTDSRQLNEVDVYQVEVRRPKNISSLQVSWQANNMINFNTNIQHTGSQYDIVFPNNIKLPEFTIFNLSANLDISKKMEAYIRLENLLDESYEEVYGYQSPGFGAYLGVTFKL